MDLALELSLESEEVLVGLVVELRKDTLLGVAAVLEVEGAHLVLKYMQLVLKLGQSLGLGWLFVRGELEGCIVGELGPDSHDIVDARVEGLQLVLEALRVLLLRVRVGLQ